MGILSPVIKPELPLWPPWLWMVLVYLPDRIWKPSPTASGGWVKPPAAAQQGWTGMKLGEEFLTQDNWSTACPRGGIQRQVIYIKLLSAFPSKIDLNLLQKLPVHIISHNLTALASTVHSRPKISTFLRRIRNLATSRQCLKAALKPFDLCNSSWFYTDDKGWICSASFLQMSTWIHCFQEVLVTPTASHVLCDKCQEMNWKLFAYSISEGKWHGSLPFPPVKWIIKKGRNNILCSCHVAQGGQHMLSLTAPLLS